jgi:hypothetical protein
MSSHKQMNTLPFFLAGIASALSFGWPAKMRYPFPFPVKAIGNDWENIGKDLALAIQKLEEKNEASQ